MLPPLQEEYSCRKRQLWSVDVKVLKYFICPESKFQCSSSCYFLYQFTKSLCFMNACSALEIMVGTLELIVRFNLRTTLLKSALFVLYR